VPVVAVLIAAAAILAGIVLAALGRAGEMATFAGDTAPMELEEVSATDVALLRPPMSLWGYNAQATEDALRVIARSVTARDVEIATLRRELANLRGGPGGGPPTAAGDRLTGPAGTPGQPRPVDAPGPPQPSGPEPSGPGPSGPSGPEPSGPSGQADPPTEPDWLPLWQRSSEPGPDE
jgi:hypothetical protein